MPSTRLPLLQKKLFAATFLFGAMDDVEIGCSTRLRKLELNNGLKTWSSPQETHPHATNRDPFHRFGRGNALLSLARLLSGLPTTPAHSVPARGLPAVGCGRADQEQRFRSVGSLSRLSDELSALLRRFRHPRNSGMAFAEIENGRAVQRGGSV
jgi:hypothetical protein